MPAYDETWFDPPAPVAYVTVRTRNGSATVRDIPMLIDTGADITLLPAFVQSTLGVTSTAGTHYELIGFDGRASQASIVDVELVFLRPTFRGQFALIDQPWGVIGRNVLNAVRLVLDGPARAWEEQPRSADTR